MQYEGEFDGFLRTAVRIGWSAYGRQSPVVGRGQGMGGTEGRARPGVDNAWRIDDIARCAGDLGCSALENAALGARQGVIRRAPLRSPIGDF
jgi:hypothetical protein